MEGSGYHDFFMVIFFRICYCDQLPGGYVSLSSAQEPDYISIRTIGGGMLPKLGNCIEAIEAGVSRVHIMDGRIMHSILLEVFSNQGIGTAILGDTEEKYYHE